MTTLTNLATTLTARRGAVRPPVYRRRAYLSTAVFAVVVAIAGPLIATSAVTAHLLNLWLIYSLAAVGFYMIYGISGRFSFCHTFMMMLGAYTSAWISARPTTTLLSMVAAIAVVAVVATVFAIATSRATDFYFAIATLGLSELGTIVFRRWHAFTGPDGARNNIDYPEFFGTTLRTNREIFWLLLIVLVLGILGVIVVERAPMRREAMAARDLPSVAATAGLPASRIQTQLFVLGSAYGAIAGALYGHWQGFVSPASFGLDLAIGVFLMVILGGSHSVWGAVIGAGVYVLLPELLSQFTRVQTLLYGAILVLILVVFPRGFLGLASDAVGLAVRGLRAARSRRSTTPEEATGE
jgi:branched-chain amino acid transport system permease protein